MRLVFILRHPAAVRSLHGVFRLLDGNGHQVHLAFQNVKSGDAHRVLQQLAAECSNLTFDRLPRRAPEAAGWTQLTREIRLSADSFRYLEPRYEHADGLRARGLAKAPEAANRVGELAGKGGSRGTAALGAGHPLARALAAGASSRGAVRRRSGARPARRHPSERVGLAAVGLRPRGEAARRAHRLPRVQLGQPDQQGPRPRRPGPGARLERASEAGGRRAPAPARRAHTADRRARVRPLVRPGARQLARVVLRRGRPRPGEAGRALRLLRPVRRSRTRCRSCGGGSRRSGGRAACSPTPGS